MKDKYEKSMKNSDSNYQGQIDNLRKKLRTKTIISKFSATLTTSSTISF